MTPTEIANYIDQNLPSEQALRMTTLREVLKYLFINTDGSPLSYRGMQVDKRPSNTNFLALEVGDTVRGYWTETEYWGKSVYLGPDPEIAENYYRPEILDVPTDVEDLRGL